MFDHIGDIGLRTIYTSFLEGTIKQASSRPNKGFSGEIFVITRLFTDEQHYRTAAAFAKNSLGRSFVQMTRSAIGRGFAHRRQT